MELNQTFQTLSHGYSLFFHLNDEVMVSIEQSRGFLQVSSDHSFSRKKAGSLGGSKWEENFGGAGKTKCKMGDLF